MKDRIHFSRYRIFQLEFILFKNNFIIILSLFNVIPNFQFFLQILTLYLESFNDSNTYSFSSIFYFVRPFVPEFFEQARYSNFKARLI